MPELKVVKATDTMKIQYLAMMREYESCIEQIKSRATVLKKWSEELAPYMTTEDSDLMSIAADKILDAVAILQEHKGV